MPRSSSRAIKDRLYDLPRCLSLPRGSFNFFVFVCLMLEEKKKKDEGVTVE